MSVTKYQIYLKTVELGSFTAAARALNFIWHGFNYPDSLPARQSFLYILLVLLMCYEAFSKLDGFTMRELFVSLACGLGYLLLAGKLVEDDAFTQGTFVLSACLLAAYALLLYAWKRRAGRMA